MSATAQATRTATFVSRGDNQRLTIEGARKVQRDSLNRIVIAPSEGKHVQFEKHYATVKPDEISERCDLCAGNGLLVHEGEATDCAKCEGAGTLTRSAAKVNGATVDVPYDDLLDWLRNHENFNLAGKPGCFWEEGAAPDEPQPTMAEQMNAIAEASVLADLTLIGEVRDIEEATHKRVAILQACDTAEKTIKALAEPIDTEPEAEASGKGEPDESGSEPLEENE
jgi:hypothetical protein